MPKPRKFTPKQRAVMDAASNTPQSAAALAKSAEVTTSVVNGLVKKGALTAVQMPARPPCVAPDMSRPPPEFSDHQAGARDKILTACGFEAAERGSLCPPPNLPPQGGGIIGRMSTTPSPQGGRDGVGGNPVMSSRCKTGSYGSMDKIDPDLMSSLKLRRTRRRDDNGGEGAVFKTNTPLKPILLDGVTGAGKTEVYFEAVAAALQNNHQVLILLPEIALSNAFLDRFKMRFGCAPALWHSGLSPAKRRRTWRGVAQGKTRVVVGARSALFLPFADLGLIVVDEEHDPSYKQEDGVIYHARDMAVVRAHMGKIPIILVSATPALETMQNVHDRRYEHVKLERRFGGARLPTINLIDLRVDKPERGDFISPTLCTAVEQSLGHDEQALLFLNRRGYAPLTLCRTCGHRINCPRCTAWLVEHKRSNKLHCHHCDFSCGIPKHCPECEDEDSLHACGPGVERIHEEAQMAFPKARIMVLASDSANTDEDLKSMLNRIHARDVDIIIGTQIIAKGHHFPQLTCVGVIDADLGLGGGELRASERTYQLLHQVAGRAGRAGREGTVYLQTFMPEHRIMTALAAGDRDAFLAIEASEREDAHMPPFARLVGVIVAGRDEAMVQHIAKTLGRTAPRGNRIDVFGPAPAPMARLRGNYRYRLLVRADKAVDIQKTVKAWVGGVKCPSTIRIQIDIDPQSFM